LWTKEKCPQKNCGKFEMSAKKLRTEFKCPLKICRLEKNASKAGTMKNNRKKVADKMKSN